MKSFFFLAVVAFVIGSFSLQAQVDKQTKIVLKNGIKVKGAILKSFDDNKLVVDVDGSEPIMIRYDHIKKITFKGNGTISTDFNEKISNEPSLKINSFYHEFRAGLLFGDETTGVLLHTINGYQFNKYLGTGLGIGVSKYGNYITLPIYTTVKGYILDRKVSPFYFGDIGYGFAWRTNKNQDLFELEDISGGLYWQVGLGYQINFYKSSLVFTLGYVNQGSKAEYIYRRPWDIDDVEVSEKRILRRFAFTVGFLF